MKVRIFSGLVLALLCVSLLPSPVGAVIRPLQWWPADLPGKDGNIILNSSEVNEIALGSGMFYAVDTANAKLYRSGNSGQTWQEITRYLLGSGAAAQWTKIAVAPDASSIVAIVTNNGTRVFFTVDAGINWYDANAPLVAGLAIQSIGVSGRYGSNNRDIVIGTAAWGNIAVTGQVYVVKLGVTIPGWRPLDIVGHVSAVAFSPSYGDSDKTILAVASRNDNTTHLAVYQPNTWTYTQVFTPVPSPLLGNNAGVTSIACSLAVPGNFQYPAISGIRSVLFSFSRQPVADNDVYRVDYSGLVGTGHRLIVTGADVDIRSIALSGTKLIAGGTNPNPPANLYVPIYFTLDAFTVWPILPLWTTATQPPTGEPPAGQVCTASVGWSGSTAYCGTGSIPGGALDESAFSSSSDSGNTWSQISLIDTDLRLQDCAISSSLPSLFMSSISTSKLVSLWRGTGEPLGKYWGRILLINTVSDPVISEKVIVRLSPNFQTDYTVYVVEVDNPPNLNGQKIWVSTSRGNSWRERVGPGDMVDFAAGGNGVAYTLLTDARVGRSINSAMSWTEPIPTCIPRGNMMYLLDAQTIFVGGKAGEVAYSTDGGMSFAQYQKLDGGLPVQVVADRGYRSNGVVYAGTSAGIYRWGTPAPYWEALEEFTDSREMTGMVTVEGILYAAWHANPGPGSGVERCLEPLGYQTEWNSLTVGSESAIFDATPTSLRFSITPGAVNLWAIDSSTLPSRLMVFGDCLAIAPDFNLGSGPNPIWTPTPGQTPSAQSLTPSWVTLPAAAVPAPTATPVTVSFTTGPVLSSPKSGATEVQVEPELKWDALTGATEYEIAVTTNPTLTDFVVTHRLAATAWQLPVELQAGTDYYWGVRATLPSLGPWSISGFSTVRPLAPPIDTATPAPLPAPGSTFPVRTWVIIVGGIAVIAGVTVKVIRYRMPPKI